MSVYTIAATILAIIGIISAIIGTGFFVVGNNYKQSILTLKDALSIYKESVLAKDVQIDGMNKKISSVTGELDTSRKQNVQIRTLNLDLQNEVIFWKKQVKALHKTYSLPPPDEYSDGAVVDTP